MSTKERLAQALTEAGAPEQMIENARNGQYDDFESDHPAPITRLVEDAHSAWLHDIAARAVDGEFDSTKEESEAWFEREGKDLLK